MTPNLHIAQGGEGEVRIALPWPDKDLSPNARVHWRRKAPKVKAARRAAWALTLEAGARTLSVSATPSIAFEFCPPDLRRRDRDNMISSLKAATDGIADALGVDDSRFITSYQFGKPVKGGAVLVTLRAA